MAPRARLHHVLGGFIRYSTGIAHAPCYRSQCGFSECPPAHVHLEEPPCIWLAHIQTRARAGIADFLDKQGCAPGRRRMSATRIAVAAQAAQSEPPPILVAQ